MSDPVVSHRALLDPDQPIESLLFDDCTILGAGVNAAGERVIFAATGDDDDLTVRHLHAVVDEATYLAFRHGSVTWLSILGMAPFYLVIDYYTSSVVGAPATIVEMTLAELDAKHVPGVDSFCPDFSRLPHLEAT